MDELNIDLIDDIKQSLIDKQTNSIELITLGFAPKDINCELQMLHILSHCVENIHIFTEKQHHKINNLINKIEYGTKV